MPGRARRVWLQIVREQEAGERNKSVCDAELKLFRLEIEPALKKVLQLVPSKQEGGPAIARRSRSLPERDRNRPHVGGRFIASEKLREEALRLAHGTLAMIRTEDGLERIRESARKQSAFEIERFRALCHAVREEYGSRLFASRMRASATRAYVTQNSIASGP